MIIQIVEKNNWLTVWVEIEGVTRYAVSGPAKDGGVELMVKARQWKPKREEYGREGY